MLLSPDLDTFRVFPWGDGERGKVARLVCDVKMPDGSDFDGDPRTCLKRVVGRAKKMGYTMMVGPEVEFFLFHLTPNGAPSARKGRILWLAIPAQRHALTDVSGP